MYIPECNDGSYYTGSTKDLNRRRMQHPNGEGANHTKKRLPVKPVYFEEFSTVQQAFRREKQVQGWRSAKKEALINGKPETLYALARCLNKTHHAGFDAAQPATQSSLSEVEGSEVEGSEVEGSEVEGSKTILK